MSEYPEHDRLAAVVDQTQAAGEFIEWLAGEHGVFLAIYAGDLGLQQIARPLEKLLAEWQGIDLCRLDSEKRQILEKAREASGGA